MRGEGGALIRKEKSYLVSIRVLGRDGKKWVVKQLTLKIDLR